MPGFAEDPRLLTKERLKQELVAHKVALPAGEHKKEVYVRLYRRHVARASGTDFSSDEDDDGNAAPSPHAVDGVVSSSDGVGTMSKMTSEEVKSGDMDVASLSNIELAEKIRTFGVDPGPIVASTRKLYEKKLLRLLEQGGVAPTTTAANNSGLNGSLQADRYSDTEEEEEEDDDEEEEEQQTAAAHGQTGEVNEIAIQTSFQSPFTTYSTKERASPGQAQDSPSGRSAPGSLRRRAINYQMAINLVDTEITKDGEVFTSPASSGETRREEVTMATSMSEDQERQSAAAAAAAAPMMPCVGTQHRVTVVQRPPIQEHDRRFSSTEWKPWFSAAPDFEAKNFSPIERSLCKSDSGERLGVLDTAMIQARSLEDVAATQEHRQKRAPYKGQGVQSENFVDARLGGGEDPSLFVSPSGISATRRRPIRSCAEGNWGDFATDSASKFSGLGNSVSRPAGQGPSTATVPAAASSAAAAKGSGLASAVPMWVRLVTFVAVCMFIALVYYALEENVQFAVPFGAEQGDAAPGEAVAAGGDDGGGATAE